MQLHLHIKVILKKVGIDNTGKARCHVNILTVGEEGRFYSLTASNETHLSLVFTLKMLPVGFGSHAG